MLTTSVVWADQPMVLLRSTATRSMWGGGVRGGSKAAVDVCRHVLARNSPAASRAGAVRG